MKYDIERAVITLSVTELCALALSSGDLDLRPGKGKRFSTERARVGVKIHQQLQAEAGVQYDAEVSFCNTTLHHGIAYEVSGRADGILHTVPITVDEIKTVGGKSHDVPISALHDAQVKCYAYFYGIENKAERVGTRLTYYFLEDGELRHVSETHSLSELRTFYLDLLSKIEYRAALLMERRTKTLPALRCGRFPYPSVRDGQDIMMRECYRTIRDGKRLFVEAPTGTGKTLSALYPAVQALGQERCDKIFYLTAKTSTGREAYRAAKQIFSAGSKIRTIVLTAREQICQNEQAKRDPAGVSRHCNPYDCPYAKGFYDRLAAATCDALSAQHGFPRQTVTQIAERFHICPYEFQLELSMLCDLIICDYNYAFDPQVYLRRYFEPEAYEENRFVFLIDEAHNLADRACSMYSAELSDESLRQLWSTLPESEVYLRREIESVMLAMRGLRRLCRDTLIKDEDGAERGYYISREPMDNFFSSVAKLRASMDTWLRAHRADPYETAVYTACSHLKRFETVSEFYDDRFRCFVELQGEECIFRLLCLDPSNILDACLSRAHASVLFSATLTPLDYFADILGGGRRAVSISLPSPFKAENCCLVAATGVSTRFEDRDKSYKKIAALIAATISGRRGNYIVYFPSYRYMEQVKKAFTARYPTVKTVVQTASMTVTQREQFLDAFVDDGMLRVGFCVLGGSFSEGVDLPGTRLIGSIIVGTGLPGLSNERNILCEHYENTRECGYDYAYTYPGMNRVLQAAGRVIRRESDTGVIVLIDDRYETDRYKHLFPDHWSHLLYARNPSELAEIVDDFWSEMKKQE